MTGSPETPSGVQSETGLFGQPRGLSLLFSTEMWERFSYYGMQALLVLFLISETGAEGFGWDKADALRLLGLYTGLIWTGPMLGGWIADRLTGARAAVALGCLLMAFGHFLMAGPAIFPGLIESMTGADVKETLEAAGAPIGALFGLDGVRATYTEYLSPLGRVDELGAVMAGYLATSISFYAALAFLIVGSGFFKGNVSAILGQLYGEGDTRRDTGYTIFYMGINLGGFLGPIVAGLLGERYGWHYGFTIAGVGMAIGYLSFTLLQDRYLGNAGKRAPVAAARAETRSAPLTAVEKDRLRALLAHILFAIVFWTAFMMYAGVINIFVYEKTDRFLFGFEVPATWFQSLNSLFILAASPLFAALWRRLALAGRDPASPQKFTLGVMVMGLSYFLMMIAALEAGGEGKANMIWVVLFFAGFTCAEMMIGPIGLSLVSKLAPLRTLGFFQGAWLATLGAGSWFAGELGARTTDMSPFNFFAGISAFAVAAAIAFYFLSGRLIGWMHGAEAVGAEAAGASASGAASDKEADRSTTGKENVEGQSATS